MARKRGAKSVKLHVSVTDVTAQQLNDLADAMQIPHAAVVRQAIARWHRQEFEPRKKNGSIINELADKALEVAGFGKE